MREKDKIMGNCWVDEGVELAKNNRNKRHRNRRKNGRELFSGYFM